MSNQSWPFGDLDIFGYDKIMADPAWSFDNWSEAGEDRNANQHYDCMTIEEIKDLPVGQLAGRDCALFLWATSPLMPLVKSVMDAWGFRFSGKAFCWAKTTQQTFKKPKPELLVNDDYHWAMKQGYTTRKNTEDCWLGLMGNPVRQSAGVRELIVAPVREHSRKPDEAYERANQLYPGKSVELFSREEREGWDVWGNQTGKFNNGEAA